jgi:hypothetical protein
LSRDLSRHKEAWYKPGTGQKAELFLPFIYLLENPLKL